MRVRSLVRDHIGFVRRTLRSSGIPSRDLDDEVQRTFISAARRIDDMRPGTERGFLFRVAMRVAARARRTHARRPELLTGDAPEPIEELLTPEHLVNQKQTCEVFDRILDGISEPLRSVFARHAFEELRDREVASILGLPGGTVASRLRRARAQLRRKIAKLALTVPRRRFESR